MPVFEQVRLVTGYVAHAALAAYWLWTVSSTAPSLRPGQRERGLRARILLIKTAAVLVTALLVAVVHYLATAWWQVGCAVVLAGGAGLLLHRAYRVLVAPPSHRVTLVGRGRRTVPRIRPDPNARTGPRHRHRRAPDA